MLARRTTEIGVRLVLGARPNQVVMMVLRESAVMLLLGLAIGIPAALSLTPLARQFLYGLKPNDPATIGISAGTLLLVALAAAFLPAFHSSRLDPLQALRTE